MRVVYVYSMRPEPDRIQPVAPRHAAYWNELRLPGYEGGPFADRSGGLITFEAASIEEAERMIASDPFAREELLDSSVVRQWLPQ